MKSDPVKSALTRRRFLAATAGFGVGASLSSAWPIGAALAAAPARTLEVTTRILEVNGKAAKVFALTSDGKARLDFMSGDRFRVKLLNRLDQPTLIHWHGLTPPNADDGVPGLTQPALVAGGSYDYDFPLARPGTNFMHSHVGLQEQLLLAAPLIIRDPAEAHLDEQEVVIQLHDFAFRDPMRILADLRKGMAHQMGAHGPASHGTAADALGKAQMQNMPMQQMQGMDMQGMNMSGDEMGQMPGMAPGMSHGGSDGAADAMSQAMMQQMANGGAMTGADLNDVAYDAFLANDRTYQDPEVMAVERGGKVRLRIINAAAASNFMIDLGALSAELIAVDGMPVRPVSDRQFALAIGQRIDLRLQLPPESTAFPVVAQLEGDRRRSVVVLAPKGAAIGKLDFLSAKPTGRFDQLTGHLVAARDPLPARPADRKLSLDLTGDMMRYRWGLSSDGGDAPLHVRKGERVEIEMVNRTGMSHPMHLHGHHFQLVAVNGAAVNGPIRDTHLVPAGGRCTIAFDADNPGRWAFHCHNLYHMVSGMMTELAYI
jgi:FtsP/CotA-like multicopper oxidase with cupredoxin domain